MSQAKKSRSTFPWRELSPLYGETLCQDVTSILGNGKHKGADSRSRHFFFWIAQSDRDFCVSATSMYRAGHTGDLDHLSAVGAVVRSLELFLEAHQNSFAEVWRRRSRAAISFLLEALGNLAEKGYPKYAGGLITSDRVREKEPLSLASFDWVEFKGLRPIDRDKLGLQLIRREASSVLDRADLLFEFGQQLLRA